MKVLTIPLKTTYIHTYIIGHYNPSFTIINLVSHTSYVVSMNFIHKWRDPQFKVNCEQQIFFWETVRRNFIYSQSFRRRNNFYILFWCLASESNPGFASNKPTHCLLRRLLKTIHSINFNSTLYFLGKELLNWKNLLAKLKHNNKNGR